MMNISPDNKYDFSFTTEAASFFSFLISQFGFNLVETSNPNEVRFESNSLFIVIRRITGHNPSVYFLTLYFGDLTAQNPEAIFGFFDLIYYVEPSLVVQEVEAKASLKNFPATSYLDTKQSLLKLSEQFSLYVKKILNGDIHLILRELSKKRESLRKKSIEENKLKEIRIQSKIMFKNRNYSDFVKIMEPIRNKLVPSEIKQLEYAKKYQD